jgi:hypothetical protein
MQCVFLFGRSSYFVIKLYFIQSWPPSAMRFKAQFVTPAISLVLQGSGLYLFNGMQCNGIGLYFAKIFWACNSLCIELDKLPERIKGANFMYPCTSRSNDAQDAGSCHWNAKEWGRDYHRGRQRGEKQLKWKMWILYAIEDILDLLTELLMWPTDKGERSSYITRCVTLQQTALLLS